MGGSIHYTRFISSVRTDPAESAVCSLIQRFMMVWRLSRDIVEMVTEEHIVLRLELQNVEPLIWRVLRVPADLRLSELHCALQTVMGWRDQHPHGFEFAKRVFTPHDRTTARDAGKHCSSEDLTIVEVLGRGRAGITYIYDSNPEWRLRITRAHGSWRPASKSPIVCLDGYLAGPLDDSRGPVAYNAILAATLGRGPRLSRAVLAHLGPHFDPERFDRSAINRELANMRVAPVETP